MKNKTLKLSLLFIPIILIAGIIYEYPEYKNIKELNKESEKCIPEGEYIGTMPYPKIPFYLKIFGIKYKYSGCCPGLKTGHPGGDNNPEDVLTCVKK